MKLRKPLIRALEKMEQVMDELQEDLGYLLRDVRDLLNLPPPRKFQAQEEGETMKWMLLLPVLFLAACGPHVGVQNCSEIPAASRDKAATAFLSCVEGATAKTTGENQDADDWVNACRQNVEVFYSSSGTQSWGADCWDCPHYPTSPCKVPVQ